MTWGWGPRPDGVIGDYSTSLTDVNFNWQGRGSEDVKQGGAKGTPAESKVAHAWPSYEAEYLQKRLREGRGKYEHTFNDPLDVVKQNVYLDKVADDYKEEADEALHTEFLAWLQGRHEDNAHPSAYVNGPGIPTRRYTDAKHLPDGKLIGEEWDHTTGKVWRPTWWGNNSLLHLPGVREYLRNMKTKSYAADLQMNLLAEHGPQDLSQAWMYFKHWVKRRPQHSNMEEGVARTDHKPGDNSRSDFGWQPSQGDDRGGGGGGDDDDGDGGPAGGGGWNFGNFRAHPDLIGPHGVDNLNKNEADILFGEPVDDAPIQSIEDVVPVVQGEIVALNSAINELTATISRRLKVDQCKHRWLQSVC